MVIEYQTKVYEDFNGAHMKILMLLHRFNKTMFEYNENDDTETFGYMMPLGMACISTYLKHNGFDVSVLNLNNRKGLIKDIIQTELTKEHYDVVFVGGTSMFYPNIRDCIKYVRMYSPTTKIVAGGGMVSAQPDIMLTLLKPDYVIIFEGEQTALELMKCISENGDVSTIDGIGYVKEGKIVITHQRKPIMDLDALPYPDFESFGMDGYLDRIYPTYIVFDSFDFPRPYPIASSRGCTHNCTFCFHTIGPKYRQRSIANIMGEVKFAVERYRANVFFFCDELFAYDRQRALDFCKAFELYIKTVPYPIHMMMSLRADCVDAGMLDAMKAAGCTVIGLGLESYSATVLKSMKKHITPAQIKQALTLIAERGMTIQGAWIFGDPAETVETAKETLQFCMENWNIIRGGAYLAFVIPFQGTPVYKHCLDKGIIPDEIAFIEERAKNGYNVQNPLNMTTMTTEEFEWLKEQILQVEFLAQYYAVAFDCKTIDGIHQASAICPYCGEMVTVKNLPYLPHGLVQGCELGCRSCSGRFVAVPRGYFFIRYLVQLFGFKRIRGIRNVWKKWTGI